MHFMIKDENIFDKYMTIYEKVNNILQVKSKKYLKAEIRFNTNKTFHCFYIPEILLDSVYRKDGNYYPKMVLEKIYS